MYLYTNLHNGFVPFTQCKLNSFRSLVCLEVSQSWPYLCQWTPHLSDQQVETHCHRRDSVAGRRFITTPSSPLSSAELFPAASCASGVPAGCRSDGILRLDRVGILRVCMWIILHRSGEVVGSEQRSGPGSSTVCTACCWSGQTLTTVWSTRNFNIIKINNAHFIFIFILMWN